MAVRGGSQSLRRLHAHWLHISNPQKPAPKIIKMHGRQRTKLRGQTALRALPSPAPDALASESACSARSIAAST